MQIIEPISSLLPTKQHNKAQTEQICADSPQPLHPAWGLCLMVNSGPFKFAEKVSAQSWLKCF